jgi:hypothetical protein
MSKVITYSRQFPANHPKVGQPTYFVEKVWQCLYNTGKIDNCLGSPLLEKELEIFSNPSHFIIPKGHTVRKGQRFKVGDMFSPRVWGTDVNPKNGKSGPYQSKQIIIAPDIEVKKVWKFTMEPANFIDECKFFIDGKQIKDAALFEQLCKNDGLNRMEFAHWFCGPELMSTKRKPFDGQIICWNEKIQY